MIPSGSTMSQVLRACENYVWSTLDVLGEGATGAVYKARHKRTGELQAVKTFNRMSHMRPLEVQIREFDVLQKLNHENIVRLLAVEEEHTTGSKVIIMELCTGGSLYNILDDPLNAYGVEEVEFFRVLHDVAGGMKHLRDKEIVHRDIKPGNIMKFIYDDGKVVYKLTDFGAARELQEEEQFMSLYGTEEYLHPDLYERAVLRRPMGKQFGVTVDLWSLGVTLYHVATGKLPFRPFGGRKNRETMYKITTEKESGVISGVQHNENGPIDWSRELPKHCQLSVGARLLVTPLLAGLLECDDRNIWTFDKFFDQVARITNKGAVHIFSACTASHICIYIDRKEGYAKLQELIAVQTDVRANQQLLLFENCLLTQHITNLQKADTYPETNKDNPIFLYNEDNTDFARVNHLEIPTLPQFSSAIALDNDVAVAKRSAGIIYLRERHMSELLERRKLLRDAVYMYSHVLSSDIEHLRSYVTQFCTLCEETEKRVTQFITTHQLQMNTLSFLLKGMGDTLPEITELQTGLTSLTNNQQSTFTEILEGVDQVKKYIEEYHRKIVQDKQLLTRWATLLAQGSDDPELTQRDIKRLKTLATSQAKSVRTVWENFRRDKSMKRLSYNDEQIHKFDRSKLSDSCTKSILMTDEEIRHTNSEHNKFHNWFSDASRVKSYLTKIEARVDSLADKQTQLSTQLTECTADYEEKLQLLLSRIGQKDPGLLLLDTGHRLVTDGTRNKSSLMTDGTVNSENSRPTGKRLSTYSRTLIKELNKCLFSLKEESSAVKNALQENSDLLKQLEELNHENGR